VGFVPAFQSPVCPRVWGSGCSRVEHRLLGTDLVSLTSTSRQLPSRGVVDPPRRVWQWNVGDGGAVSDTLLGPEGSDDTRRPPVLFRVSRRVWAGFFWLVGPAEIATVSWWVWGAGCILRTSQWTRASL
jgi:hypothetical protein